MAGTEVPREKLKELVAKNGDSLFQDRDRCEGLLKDYCGSHRREISAIVGAIEERVPIELRSSWQMAMTPEAMRARLVQRLEENRGLAPEIANYAVEAWSYALGVDLGRSSERVQDVAPAPHAGLTTDQRPGGIVLPLDPANRVGKSSYHNKAIAGGVGLLAAAAVVFAMLHHPGSVPASKGIAPGQPQNPAGGNSGMPGAHEGVAGANSSAANDKKLNDDGNGIAGVDASHGTSAGNSISNSGSGNSTRTSTIPVGTPVVVRLNSDFDSDNARVGDVLPASVVTALSSDGNVVVQRGAKAQVKVLSIDKSGQLGGNSHVQFALVRLAAHGKLVRVTASSMNMDGPSQAPHAAEKSGLGNAAGAALGAIKGHLFHRAGSGSSALAPTPAPVKVSAETTIQFRLTKGLTLGS